ncbi:MAG: hypothetical protein NC041_02995 [Bacteroides sp.]|nr:hypothetical protein [Treponema brennaborense]MCM1469421.1 hypothetical protein [Bacteroides sp.]
MRTAENNNILAEKSPAAAKSAGGGLPKTSAAAHTLTHRFIGGGKPIALFPNLRSA